MCFRVHRDKLCDAIADALVEEAARREKRALCGIEVAVYSGPKISDQAIS
jgi:S-adenosylmethionine synthetase